MLGLFPAIVLNLGGSVALTVEPCPMVTLELASDDVTLALRDRGAALELLSDPIALQLADDAVRLRLRC